MIHNISHQWRQPLAEINSIVLLLDTFLPENVKANKKIEKALDEIEQITQHMSQTIDDFGNFFSKNKVQNKELFYSIVYESLLVIKGDLTSTSTEVIKDIAEDMEFCGYVSELKQVLVILIKNANDALRNNNVTNPRIFIKAFEENGVYKVVVSDNAGGIPSDIIGKIFDPYFTTKHKSRGTGIGLYMAKMIVEEGMKGYIKVQNNESGAEFRIDIPKGSTNARKHS